MKILSKNELTSVMGGDDMGYGNEYQYMNMEQDQVYKPPVQPNDVYKPPVNPPA